MKSDYQKERRWMRTCALAWRVNGDVWYLYIACMHREMSFCRRQTASDLWEMARAQCGNHGVIINDFRKSVNDVCFTIPKSSLGPQIPH